MLLLFYLSAERSKVYINAMNRTLTALILLCSTSVFAEDSLPRSNSATNSPVITKETDSYKPHKPSEKTDAYTGATREGKKQK
jgi:hypothetical protein